MTAGARIVAISGRGSNPGGMRSCFGQRRHAVGSEASEAPPPPSRWREEGAMRCVLRRGVAIPRSRRGAVPLPQESVGDVLLLGVSVITTRQRRSRNQNRKNSRQNENQLHSHLAHGQVSPLPSLATISLTVALADTIEQCPAKYCSDSDPGCRYRNPIARSPRSEVQRRRSQHKTTLISSDASDLPPIRD